MSMTANNSEMNKTDANDVKIKIETHQRNYLQFELQIQSL